MNRKGKRNKGKNPLKGSLLWMPVLTLGLCLLGAKLILQGMIPEEKAGIIGLFIAGVVAFVGGRMSGRRVGEQRLLWSVGTAAAYGCLLMLGNLLFFGVAYHAIGGMWICVLLGGILAGMLPYKKKGKIA